LANRSAANKTLSFSENIAKIVYDQLQRRANGRPQYQPTLLSVTAIRVHWSKRNAQVWCLSVCPTLYQQQRHARANSPAVWCWLHPSLTPRSENDIFLADFQYIHLQHSNALSLLNKFYPQRPHLITENTSNFITLCHKLICKGKGTSLTTPYSITKTVGVEASGCERLAQSRYAVAPRPGIEPATTS